jgi:hypothetical protein
MPFRTKPSRAALCIAIAVFTTVLIAMEWLEPASSPLALWQIVPLTVVPTAVLPETVREKEQTSALLSLAFSRPPPSFRVSA